MYGSGVSQNEEGIIQQVCKLSTIQLRVHRHVCYVEGLGFMGLSMLAVLLVINCSQI